MFAYCCNNPVLFLDPSGTASVVSFGYDSRIIEPTKDVTTGGGINIVVSALGAAVTVAVVATTQNTHKVRTEQTREVYQYQKVLKQEYIYAAPQAPHVHHIVPVGTFSGRSVETQNIIREMHHILKENGVNRFIDPMNLVLVSAKTHASLHTDTYIAHVYSYIKQVEGSREAIYAALFYLRIEIAAMDVCALGY